MSEPTVTGIGMSIMGGSPNLDDLARKLDEMAPMDVDAVELSAFEDDVIVGGRILPDRLKRYRQICEARPFRYTVHGPLRSNLMDPEHVDLHKQVCGAFLEFTAAIGAEVEVHHTGIMPSGPAWLVEEYHAREAAALAELGEKAKSLGIRIAVECLFAEQCENYTATPARLAEEIRAVGNDHVVATLDFSHAYIQCNYRGLDYLEEIKQFAPVVGHLHIHDSFGRPTTLPPTAFGEAVAYGQGDLHMPIGWGDLPWDRILPELPFGPQAIAMLEVRRRWWSEIDHTLSEVRRFRDIINTAAERRADFSQAA